MSDTDTPVPSPSTPLRLTVEPASAVLGVAADLPDATPGLVPGQDSASPRPGGPGQDSANLCPGAPAPQPVAAQRDRKGTVWDPAIHESPPRKNADNLWAKLRGNAARRSKGLPPSGAVRASTKPAAPAGEEPAPQVAEAPQAPPMQSQPPPVEMLNGGPGPVLDAQVAPADLSMRPIEDYAGTASAVTDTTFAVARWTMGPAWEYRTGERRDFVSAWQRLLHHYQTPILGPFFNLLALGAAAFMARSDDKQTRGVLGRLWDRITGTIAPPPPRPVDPYAAPAPPSQTRQDAPPPADAAPAKPVIRW